MIVETSSSSARADMRYVGQEHAVTVDMPLELFAEQDRAGIKQRFDAVHEARYSYPRRTSRPRSSACASPSSA